MRRLPAWESGDGRDLRNFLATTAAVLFRPTQFYKTLATRRDVRPARLFADIHWTITSILFGAAAYGHLAWYIGWNRSWAGIRQPNLLIFLALIVFVFTLLRFVTYVAAWLTNWEASYRGLRLPLNVVLRGMYYHSAHYLPVAAAAALTVYGFQFLLNRGVLTGEAIIPYLYVLCAEVIVFAAFLFYTYWIGMKNMMYANG
jgi:hypothetical protein